jgi:fructose-1-phosphate kinase PfkB-like protein
MLAGMIAACLRQQDARQMLRFGVVCGSATASHPGTELFSRSDVEATEYDLTLTALDI